MTDDGDAIARPQRVSKLEELAAASVPGTQPERRPQRPERQPGAGPDTGRPDVATAARREFARLLGEFRRTAVLVPYDEHGSLWTADLGGVRWICAFSDEDALARFAEARRDAAREWTYRTILGARLLDVMVPMLPGPGGVALDAGSTDGMLFPPVAGIVPDKVAVDLGETGAQGER
ncbi:SseB family protein [Streptomyces sp. NPDC046237]|uniref:SseB family protein n=1 Tax=Streptomyces sp. NPDC046237 TaxID=3154914 RepID=UPI0033F6EA34